MRRGLMIIYLIFGPVLILNGQVPDSTRGKVQQELEEALEGFDPTDPDLDSEQLTQLLQDLASAPLNINTASAEDLLIVPGVNLQIVRSLIDYRESVKPFERVDELLEVKGIGPATLKRIRPYVTVGVGFERGKILYTNYRYWTSRGRLEVFSRYRRTLQEQEGYRRPDSAGGYLGGPLQYYQRFRYRSDHLSLNLTQQKDAGEPFAGPTGFDFTSWHIALSDNGKLQNFVAGDYTLNFGQGLVIWNGRTFGKGREVIGSAGRNSRGVRPYASSQESDFLRGVAATYGGSVQLTGFFSHRKLTASRVAADTTRFPADEGYHRTQAERMRRNSLSQSLWGGRIRTEFPFGVIGFTGYRTIFDKYVVAGTDLASRYDFRGREHAALGLDYTVLAGPALLFGEAARTQNGGWGVVTGVESEIGPHTDFAVAYRNYSRAFQSIMGNGFGERSGDPQNEEGIYVGLRHELSRAVTLSAYFDQYRFAAPRFGIRQPSSGYEWLTLAEWELNRRTELYIQLRSETKDDEYEGRDNFGRAITRIGKAERSTLRAHLEYRINPRIRLRTRGEAVRSRRAGGDPEYGYLLFQDLRITPARSWSVDARISVFDTESFDTRLYQFESDLLYLFSNQVLYNQGQRLYLLFNLEPLPFLECWAKYGVIIYENQHVVGSGLNESEGNRRSDISFQVRLRF